MRPTKPLLVSVCQTVAPCPARLKTQPLSLYPKLAKFPGKEEIHSVSSSSASSSVWNLGSSCPCFREIFLFLFKNSNYFQQKHWAATSYSILSRNRSLVYFFNWDVCNVKWFEKNNLHSTSMYHGRDYVITAKMYKMETWLYKEWSNLRIGKCGHEKQSGEVTEI